MLCVRAPVGIVNLTDREVVIGRGLCSIGSLKNNTKYLFYLMKTYENYFNERATGSTFSAITKEVVYETIIPLPPLSEQKRIVEIVERNFNRLDEVEKLINENKKKLELLEKSILEKAFRGEIVQ